MKILKEQEIDDNGVWVEVRINLAKLEPQLIIEHFCLNCEGRGCYSCYRSGKTSIKFSEAEMKNLGKSLSPDASNQLGAS